MRILIIEDDALVADGMRRGLSQVGFAVDHVPSAELAEAALQQENFDLVLIVTARDALADRVGALDLGADDYLVKPFALPELAARCRALIRRSKSNSDSGITIGP